MSFSLLALALRLLRLNFQPLWWDEGYSVWFATHSLGEMAALTAEDIHPPLYYALLHLWTLIAGPGPVSVRLVSVAAGVAAIPLMYVAARRIFGSTKVALLAAFLLAINPLFIYYSQEVRMYGLVALLCTGILWAAWGVIEDSATDGARSRGPAIAYTLLTTLALYTQYYVIFLPVGLTVYALWRFRRQGKRLLHWVALQLVVALLYLPWVVYAAPRLTLYVSQKVVADADKPLGLVAYFGRHLSAFAAGHLEGGLAPWWPLALVLLVPIAVGLALLVGSHRKKTTGIGEASGGADRPGINAPDAGAGAKEQRPRPPVGLNGAGAGAGGSARAEDTDQVAQGVLFLGIVLLVALFLGWLIGLRYPFFPDRGERLLLLALPAFVMLAAAGLVALFGARLWAGYLGLGLFVLVSAASLAAFYTVPRYPDDDYRALIARTIVQGAPGDTVFAVYPWQVGYWRSYAAGSDGPTALLTPEVKWGEKIKASLNSALQRGHVWFPAHLALGGILETQVEQYLASVAMPFANTWYGPGTRLSAWQAEPASPGSNTSPGPASPVATYALSDGNSLALASVSAPAGPVAAENHAVPITMAWVAGARPELSVSVRLVDDLGQIWAQNDYEPLGAMVGSAGGAESDGKWQAADNFGLLIPAGTPPGHYKAQLVLLPAKGNKPLAAVVPGQATASSVPLFDIEVTPASQPLSADRLPIAERQPAELQDGLRFLGYTVDSTSLAPGESRRVNLFWQATAQPSADYTAFVQMLGKDGSPVAGWEAPPGAAYPTSKWAPGTLIRTQASFRPNADLPDGRYSLIAGLYRTGDGARLKTQSGNDSLSLGSVDIKGRPRQMTRPQPEVAADATFGSSAHLVGYDVTTGTTPSIRLYWEALGATDRPYTVFVHVLDDQGQVTGYGDSEPGNGAYPTTGWRRGEYLADEHAIQATPSAGSLRVAIGLYDPYTGQRLLTETGEDQVVLAPGR